LLDDPEDSDELAQRILTWNDARIAYARATQRLALELRRHTWEAMAKEIVGLVSSFAMERAL
jgi:hypothetical protein